MKPIGPSLTLAALFPEGNRWAAQFYAGVEPAGGLAGYISQTECQDAATALLRQLGQHPQVTCLASREAADALAPQVRHIEE
jgi:hypothetical protein